jgi:hypothetical protein
VQRGVARELPGSIPGWHTFFAGCIIFPKVFFAWHYLGPAWRTLGTFGMSGEVSAPFFRTFSTGGHFWMAPRSSFFTARVSSDDSVSPCLFKLCVFPLVSSHAPSLSLSLLLLAFHLQYYM